MIMSFLIRLISRSIWEVRILSVTIWFGFLANWTLNCGLKNSYGTSVKNVPLSTSSPVPGDIERVNSVKLLGINLDADFSWKSHVEAITSKATQRLYFLKQLKRAGVPQAQLLYFYTGVIRPVLEYAAPVWNHLLTITQIDQIEAIQRRALRDRKSVV